MDAAFVRSVGTVSFAAKSTTTMTTTTITAVARTRLAGGERRVTTTTTTDAHARARTARSRDARVANARGRPSTTTTTIARNTARDIATSIVDRVCRTMTRWRMTTGSAACTTRTPLASRESVPRDGDAGNLGGVRDGRDARRHPEVPSRG